MIHKVGATPTPAPQTVIIWDELISELKFFVVDGDQTKFNKVYINHVNCDENLQDELNKLMYNDEGKYINEELTEFPVNAVLNGAAVIVAGFLP